LHFRESRYREANNYDVDDDFYDGMRPHDVNMRQTRALVLAIPLVPQISHWFAGKNCNKNRRYSPAACEREDEISCVPKIIVREEAEEKEEHRCLGESY
jgi:hypothetical protein